MSRLPTMWSRFRQTFGRALRETGQALDRVGLRGETHALTTRLYGDDPSKFDDHLSRHRHLMPLLKRGQPMISSDAAYLAPCSTLIGTVQVGARSSIWYGAILKADQCRNGRNWKTTTPTTPLEEASLEPWEFKNDGEEEHQGGAIFIGEDSNVQDGCVITSREEHTIIGNGVTIGHLAQIHSAKVGDYSLIGMGSVLGERSVVESEAFIAAGAVVGPGVTVPTGELWAGNPARKLRDLTEQERAKLHYQSEQYVLVAQNQREVMQLGGNMPDSLVQFAMLGTTSYEEGEELQPMERKQEEPELEPVKINQQ